MWPYLVAVAVAGSGFIASRLFRNADSVTPCSSAELTEKCEQKEVVMVKNEDKNVPEEQDLVDPVKPEVSVFHGNFSPPIKDDLGDFVFTNCQRQNSTAGGKGIFRFSSLGCGDGSELQSCSKISRKKADLGFHRRKGNAVGVQRRNGVENQKLGTKSGVKDGGVAVLMRQIKRGRKFSFCLKRRRTSKNPNAKCGSCSSEGSSIFSWGLGVGIMCMSAGKAEIEKLNTTINETVKIVQQLKTELHKRKEISYLQDSSCNREGDACQKNIGGKHVQKVVTKSCVKEGTLDESKIFSCPLTDDGECASSVLTEEPEPEVLEMEQLEAELESELQKIPWCLSEEATALEGSISSLNELDTEKPELSGPEELVQHKPEDMGSNSIQLGGVSPSELDKKLCHLLIEQQESQIIELESQLQSAQAKLHDKEAELKALKNCVYRLSEFSLDTDTDEETGEAEMQIEEKGKSNSPNKKEQEKQKSVVGMKRLMEFETYDCHGNSIIPSCGWECL